MSLEMTDQQREEMARIQDIVMAKVRVEVAAMAEIMVLKSNGEFFGETEFVLRDRCHTIGGHVREVVVGGGVFVSDSREVERSRMAF